MAATRGVGTAGAERAGVLQGKAVVVTGAGQGLGAAYARLAAAQGARVLVNDIDAAAAQAVVQGIEAAGGQAAANAADISIWAGAAELIGECIGRFGTIDGLVNNAARFYMSRPEDEEEAAMRALLAVNVLGTAFCGVHALRHMLARGRGAIVNVTSGSQTGTTLQGVYGASKGAVASLTYSWSVDAAPHGVRVNAVSPMAKTPMADVARSYFTDRHRMPWPQVAVSPEDNAPVVAYLLSDAAQGVNGQVVRIDGDRLSLMTHPAVLHPPLESARWGVDEVAQAFEAQLKSRQLPVGVVGAELVLHPYALRYPRAADAGG
ncbi:NAD(P)-dependent dehydrogenase (short-subunit alcohol dehydrogenase family) [Variovorax sp. 54]|uniref:SDR family NAD(P)-dependent oxidoreductase n=1 Tax=Variovorax sp. 54 TaxID=2035212 RepID=UPI000C49E00D|nr:SDR family oxidoreductase [Variovorax sp. 54]PIF73710.1 NAD(P)-dependent dehydrogenase (short-subunit alcohol dehydrogenase family) [Variovorax sp. 54]